MHTVELDTKEASNKWWAHKDARMTSLANASHFEECQKIQAEKMKQVLPLVYSAKGIYINYRKTMITIKVDKCWVKNKRDLALLEADWQAQGIKIRPSAQGVNYNIPRA
jgi:hypothetical protein